MRKATKRQPAPEAVNVAELTGPPANGNAPHPDDDLLEAWAGYVQANRDFDAAVNVLPDGGTDADHKPFYQRVELYRQVILRHHASTVEGFAVQLRYLFMTKMECLDSFRAAIYGEPLSEELSSRLAEDYRDRMLWEMAQAAARASRVQ
ncbi:hypothetical protein [Azospirillum argentinense]